MSKDLAKRIINSLDIESEDYQAERELYRLYLTKDEVRSKNLSELIKAANKSYNLRMQTLKMIHEFIDMDPELYDFIFSMNFRLKLIEILDVFMGLFKNLILIYSSCHLMIASEEIIYNRISAKNHSILVINVMSSFGLNEDVILKEAVRIMLKADIGIPLRLR